jgi:uncharacterized membrane protein
MSDQPLSAPTGDLEAKLSKLLSASVLLAAGVGLVGIVMYLLEHRGVREDLSVFVPEPEGLREPGQIAAGAWALDSAAVLQLAVLLLVLTPIARVVFSLVMFAVRRDWLYVVVTTIVLGALAVGLLLGR